MGDWILLPLITVSMALLANPAPPITIEYFNYGLGYQFSFKNTPCAVEFSWRGGRTSLNGELMNNRSQYFIERNGIQTSFVVHLFSNHKKP
jgi:hypothetical protein